MYLTQIVSLFVLMFGFSLTIHAQTKDFFDEEKLESYLNSIHSKKGFNGEVLVAKGKNILFQKAVGFTSYENNLELHIDAKYRIASITKTFTGTLIAMAQQEKKINLNDKACDYIETLSKKFQHITIKQLVTHTSGLPHNEGIEDYWLTKSKLQMTTKQVIAEINALKVLFEPEAKMSYSSLGYYILATILEKVYKNDFHTIVKDKILDKLQMNKTGTVNTLQVIPKMTSGYHLVTDDSLVVAPYRNYSLLKGAGDMYSTSTDLLTWNNSFFSNTFISEQTASLLFDQSSKTRHGSDKNYEYGWYSNTTPILKKFHGGGTWGYSTHNALYPGTQMSIIILSNISTLPISAIANNIEKIVFNEKFQLPKKEVIVETNTIDLNKYHGKYISDSNKMVLLITKVDDNLYAKLGRNPPFKIYPKGNHEFFGKKIDIVIRFENTDTTIVGLKAERLGKTFHFNKSIH